MESTEQHVMWILIEFAILSVVVFSSLLALSNIESSTTPERQFIANDIGLYLSAVENIDGSFTGKYMHPGFEEYVYRIEDGLVRVDHGEGAPIFAHFGRDLNTHYVTGDDRSERVHALPVNYEGEELTVVRGGDTTHFSVQDTKNVLYRGCSALDFGTIALHVDSKSALGRGAQFLGSEVIVSENPVGGSLHVRVVQARERTDAVMLRVGSGVAREAACHIANTLNTLGRYSALVIVPDSSLGVSDVVVEMDVSQFTQEVGKALVEGLL